MILEALPCLIDTLFHSLKVLSMIVSDAEPKVLNTEIFPQHIIADLNYGIAFVLFSQEKLLLLKERKNKYKCNTHNINAVYDFPFKLYIFVKNVIP